MAEETTVDSAVEAGKSSEGTPASEATQGQGASPLVFTDPVLAENPTLKLFKDTDALGKAHVNLVSKLGQRPEGPKIPAADAPQEEWAAYWKQVPGYPEAPDKYDVAFPDLPPNTVALTDEQRASFLSEMHKAGATKGVVEAALRWHAQHTADMMQSFQEASQTQINDAYQTLQKEWTANTDVNLLVAEEYLRRTYGEDAGWWDQLIERKDGRAVPLRNMPEFVKMAFELGRIKGMDKFVRGDGAGGMLSAEGAKQRLDEAYAQHAAGKITSQELSAAINQYQPIISRG